MDSLFFSQEVYEMMAKIKFILGFTDYDALGFTDFVK